VHALDAVPDDDRHLVREGRVVRAAVRHGGGEYVALSVTVLQALARERGAAGGRAEQEAAAALVPEAPDEVAHALEAEHRIEDVERDHRLAPRGVARPDRGRRRHRAGLGDPLLEDPPLLRLAVAEEEPGIDRLVLLSER